MYNSEKPPLVSIITVNYKQTDVTLQLLDSLARCTYPSLEIIVVDNGSGQGLHELLQTTYPTVKSIPSTLNLGFAGGNNLGIEQAKGTYLLFINNDTEVEPNFLEPMVQLFESESNLGMVSPKIIFYGTGGLVQYAGSAGINPVTGRAQEIKVYGKDEGQYDGTFETKLGHGAAMMIPRKVIQAVGMMPDIYFLYYEEHDWCEAIKRAGYRVFYTSRSVVYHKESISVGKESPLKTYYMARNRILYLRRNIKGIKFVSSLLFFICFTIPKTTLKYIKDLKWMHLREFYRGMSWNLFHYRVHGLPRMKNV